METANLPLRNNEQVFHPEPQPTMSEEKVLKGKLHQADFKKSGNRFFISFGPILPDVPGVYKVLRKKDRKPFYIGETKNLFKRLKFLFRCNPGKNPHPCHTAYRNAYGSYPQIDEFCKSFIVEVTDTSKMFGRIELEERLQSKLGTNRKDFYQNWK
jgi:hypothetical protein